MNIIKDSSILITGGAGFLGSYIIEELIRYQPKQIYVIDNLIRGSLENMASFINDSRVTFFEDDIRNEKLINKLMSQSDYCFHAAALRINKCAENPADAFDVMLKSTFHIIEAAKNCKIKKFIYSSSASVYGLAQNFPTPETDNPYSNTTFYGAGKLFGEQMLHCYYDIHKLNYVALRYFNIYGPRMDTDGRYTELFIKWLKCIQNKQQPLIFGDGSTAMDFVYVTDVAKANIAALLNDVTDEAVNVGCGKETSLTELLKLILSINNSSIQPKYMPENIINPVKKRCADIRKAKRLLGFKPTVSLKEGIKLLSDWYFKKTEVVSG